MANVISFLLWVLRKKGKFELGVEKVKGSAGLAIFAWDLWVG